MYTIYVKFDCLPGKREAFLAKMKETGVLDASFTIWPDQVGHSQFS